MQNEIKEKVVEEAREILEHPFFTLGDHPVNLASVLTFGIILVATFVVSALLQRALVRLLRRRGADAEGAGAVTRRLLHYAVVVVGLAVAFQNLGVDLNALFAAGAVFAVAVGFAMQNIVQNFVSGVILLIERVIKPGDVLRVDGEVVRVVNMGIRSTVVRTRDEEDLIVPNSTLVQSTVANYTLRDALYRLRADVGVTYDSDLKKVHAVLEQVAQEQPWRDRRHPPVVMLRGFGASSVDFQVSVWIDGPWDAPRRLSDLHQAIWWAFEDHDIVIAFPQLDVHFDPGSEVPAVPRRRAGEPAP